MRASDGSTGALIDGRYRRGRLLGRGGVGSVHAVHDASTGRTLALKQLMDGQSAASRKLFEREFRTLAGLRHEHIVRVHDYGIDDGGPYYTMELLEGGDLSRQAPMPWRDVCTCLRDVASVLGVLHARRLVHRDLSPKNLWRTTSGRLKLIDFGAISPFGRAREIVGTTPFIAPEALVGDVLDQRTDLFAIGALGYWLLTGLHAYPASELAELSALHQREPSPPSLQLSLLGVVGEPMPPALDQLIGTLLRAEPSERPASTGELIDRLHLIADLAPEPATEVMQSYLASKLFVDRAREIDAHAASLERAREGAGSVLLIVGDSGSGKSRLLDELVVESQIAGATSVRADARFGDRALSAIELIAHGLLDALPESARRAAAPYLRDLCAGSAELRQRLDADARRAEPGSDGYIRYKVALTDWLMALGAQSFIALIVDDLDALDPDSQSVLAALALGSATSKIALVVSARETREGSASAAVVQLAQRATTLQLAPLGGDALLALLRSVFGDTPFLERCADRLAFVAQGNVQHFLALGEHLVQIAQVTYADGAWILPSDVPLASLPQSRDDAWVTKLAALPSDARALAEVLSIARSWPLSRAQCHALSELSTNDTERALARLVQAGVLTDSHDVVHFASESVRAMLESALAPTRAQHAHVALGEALTKDEPIEQMRAAVHLLRGKELKKGRAKSVAVTRHFHLGDISKVHLAAPLVEKALELLDPSDEREYLTVDLLTLLCLAGFFADRRYAVQYGDRAIDMQSRLLCFPLYHRLARWLGKRLAIVVALLVASVKLRMHGRGVVELITQLVAACTALSGAAASHGDSVTAVRHADALRPLAEGLGVRSPPHIIHEVALAFALQPRIDTSASEAAMGKLLARLEHDSALQSLPPAVRNNTIAGLLSSLGVAACTRDDPAALAIADRLERYGPVQALYADQVRAAYHANQGRIALAEHYRKQVELHAMKIGSAWQVEGWAAHQHIYAASRLHEAILAKQAAQVLARIARELPHTAQTVHHARGTYLVLRGKFGEALPLLESGLLSPITVNRSHVQGMLARALNGLGAHARARDLCRDALAQLPPEELAHVATTLDLPMELARAELGLGDVLEARAQIERLLVLHASNEGAVTLGALHELAATAALAAKDIASARKHLAEMIRLLRPTAVAGLLARAHAVQRAVATAEGRDVVSSVSDIDRLRVQLDVLTRAHGDSPSGRAEAVLRLARELADADAGCVAVRGARGAIHVTDPSEAHALMSWADARLSGCEVDEATTLEDDELELDQATNQCVIGGKLFSALPLWTTRDGQQVAVAMLVLGHRDAPRLPAPEALRIFAHCLDEARTTLRQTQTGALRST